MSSKVDEGDKELKVLHICKDGNHNSEYQELKKPDRLRYKYLREKCVQDAAGHKGRGQVTGALSAISKILLLSQFGVRKNYLRLK